ncbi:MAG: DUF3592 domain-containing protein [Nitrosomonadales bacterium]
MASFGAALFVLISILVELSDLIHASHVRSWPVLIGHVTYSAPEKGCDKGLHFAPKINYYYSVNGRRFEGNQVQYQILRCGTEESIALFTSKYPVGSLLSVQVNPDSPEESVAIVDKEQNTIPGLLIGWLIAFPILVVSGYIYLRRYKRLGEVNRSAKT